MLALGCSPKYKVLTELEEPIARTTTCVVGEITDELPMDMDAGDKPTTEDIGRFKSYLHEELVNRKIMDITGIGDSSSDYMVRGAIIEFKKGSGFLRFLIGFGAGSASVTVTLELVDIKADRVVFSGNFKGSVSDWPEAGDKTFKKVSKNFSKALEKRIKKLNKAAA